MQELLESDLAFCGNNLSRLMSSRRFELIMKFLHLNNSEIQPPRGAPSHDKLFKVHPFMDIVMENFKAAIYLVSTCP